MSASTTKSMIIRSMLKLVRRKKFSSITISDICEMTGINRRTFYRYYSDKYDLLRDVYVECFFSKIKKEEARDFWDLFGMICDQIYSDKSFFRHAFAVKEQNGFWEEIRGLLKPLYMCEAQETLAEEEIRDFFASTDMDRMFHLIETWINSESNMSSADFTRCIKVSFYISGVWTAQLAAGIDRTVFSPEIYQDFEKYLKNHPEKLS